MELCIKLATRPLPGVYTRIFILITIIVVVLAIWRAGYALDTAIPLVLGAGLAGAQVARALLAGVTPAPLTAASPHAG